MTRHLAIAVGDTAGHVMPALAVAEAYAARAGGLDIRFFAAGEGTGHPLVGQAGYPLHYLPGSPIARAGRLEQIGALVRAASAVAKARHLLTRYGVRLVIGTGGYGSASALLAARSLGLMTSLVEPNLVPGLANRMLGRVVHRVYVGFEDTRTAFPAGRALRTGVPVRRAIARMVFERRPPALPRLRLLVTSGSRGEPFLAARVPDLAARLRREGLTLEVRHQGGADAVGVQQVYDRLGIAASVEPFIEDMADALEWADLLIARAGAGTIAELALAAVPSLLVPLADAAHDHQAANAAALAARGAALWTREQDWDTELLARDILVLVRDGDLWRAAVDATSAWAIRDAAERIVGDCEAMMEGRW